MEIYIDQNEQALISQKYIYILKTNFKKWIFQLHLKAVLLNVLNTKNKNKDQQDDLIIPPYLFEEPWARIVVEFPFCEVY